MRNLLDRHDSILGKLIKRIDPYKYAIRYNREITFPLKSGNSEKRALVSYILAPFSDVRRTQLSRHANYGNAWDIVDILNDLGFEVDVVEASNDKFIPEKQYDLVIGTLHCIDRFSPFLGDQAKTVFYAFGAYVEVRNGPDGELSRVKSLEHRTGMNYVPKRLYKNPEMIKRSVEKADALIVVNGEATIESFPSSFSNKLHGCTMPIYPETIPGVANKYTESSPKEFIWFFGFGQVHKGLDLVIDAFMDMPEFRLNIVGTMEPDFRKIYSSKIESAPNIINHGFLDTSSHEFEDVIRRCFCFVAPSVNEGISCAGATLLQLGLYPIISYETGLDLPKNTGVILNECTKSEIITQAKRVFDLSIKELNYQTSLLKEFSQKKYSPDVYRAEFKDIIIDITGK